MRKQARYAIIAMAVMAASLLLVAQASGQAGVKSFDSVFLNEDGSVATQAGSHPFAFRTGIEFSQHYNPVFEEEVPDSLRDLQVKLPSGFTGTDQAMPTCPTADFLLITKNNLPDCPNNTAVGASRTETAAGPRTGPIFNLPPPPGVIVKLGYWVFTVPVIIEVGLEQSYPYRVVSNLINVPQPSLFYRGRIELWGDPASPAHDPVRGECLSEAGEYHDPFVSTGKTCEVNLPEVPFFTLPRSCQGPMLTDYAVDSWQAPGSWLPDGEPNLSDPNWASGQIESVDDETPPNPQGLTGCSRLNFNPSITAQPTTKAANSPTGLDFSLNLHDEGLTNPEGLAQSDFRKTEVTLPEGFSLNSAIAEGLEVCTEADLARESSNSEAGAGCPNASKIGTVEVETPLLDENVNGALYQAAPYENPFHSLVALYIVIKNPTLGIKVVQPLNVIPDPVTGRLRTVAEEMPQLPFSHFKLHFREGTRSPLASPPGCGTYNAEASLYPSSGGPPVHTTSAFQIITGPDAGPCPSGGLPPFHPGLIAGSINNAAGRFSPFNVRLFRTDSEQEITHFSIKLPPGITAKLAGVPYCSNAQIANAKARSGPHGGAEELASPSCPQASEVGHTLVGGGVGSALAYAPGKVYLAGPYNGSNLSIVSITAGIVGPFDIGTVVVREALKIDPETAEAFIDATGSDPIPHIIKGIPIHLRDVRVYTDRPNFVLNPTDCSRTSTASTVLGSGLDFGSEADDRPITVSTPYQAADCAALPFAPKLGLKLNGGTRRGAHPAFTARLAMNGIGEAGIARAEVTLPKSEFLENKHIETICTRVQFKAGAGNGAQCPARSIYGKARAITPILGEPLTGPVFLRSSEHQLPDLVVALHNAQVDFDLIGRIDSLNGRIRNTFEAAPDAPVSSFVLEMQGGKKGLLVNSTNLCKGTHKAESNFTGQNGKRYDTRPALKAKCGAQAKKKHKRSKHRAR